MHAEGGCCGRPSVRGKECPAQPRGYPPRKAALQGPCSPLFRRMGALHNQHTTPQALHNQHTDSGSQLWPQGARPRQPTPARPPPPGNLEPTRAPSTLGRTFLKRTRPSGHGDSACLQAWSQEAVVTSTRGLAVLTLRGRKQPLGTTRSDDKAEGQ